MSDYEQVLGTTVSFDLAGFEYEQVSGTTVDIELQLRDPQPGTFSATSTFSGEGFTARRGTFSATSEFSSVGVGSASASGSFDPTAAFNAVAFASASASGTFSATSTFTGSGPNVGLFEPQSTFGADTIGLTGDNLPVEWRVTRDGEFVEDAVFDVDPVVDTANPFGDYCVIKMDDSNGEKFANYARGTRVDVAVSENAGISFDNRFTGYVVERRETEQDGADVLEVEAYSFDQFLRRNTVTNDQRGNSITEALEDIIQTDTPVTYDPELVEVGDDQELTRTYQGEAVETVLRDLAFKSNNEDFGVNDDLEFFFRERENVHIDRGIDNTQWFNYDIPELGKEAINEVEVWFDDGEESVIVDDGTDKLDLQDSLDLADPGTQRAELNRPLLTDISDAEDEGRKYLQFRNSTLSGTVTTFGLFDAEPGDTIDIEIQPRGIDEEFVIAAIEYRWGVDETILTIVEKRGDVDDILSELNESVQRVEMEGANRDAPKNRITTTNAGAVISVNVDADGTTPSNTRFVNDGRRAVRDAWTGDDPPEISTLVVGDDGSGLSRSNSSLRNQTNSAAVTQSLPDSKSVVFEATITQTGVRELGLDTSDGRLITRVVFDDAVDIDGTVSVTLDVSNDESVSRGVLTNDGQTAVRDVLADNSPTLPADYGYGSDDTAVAETDTALGNELVSVSIDDVLIQSADTTTEWEDITNIADTDPFVVQNDQLQLAQSCYVFEAQDTRTGEAQTTERTDFSSGEGIRIPDSISSGDVVAQFTVDLEYDISNVSVGVREEHTGDSFFRFAIDVDGSEENSFDSDTSTVEWRQVSIGSLSKGSRFVELRVDEVGPDNPETEIDIFAVYDSDISFNFDNDVNEDDGYLDGPELYADSAAFGLNTATSRQKVTEGQFVSTWDDTTNNQYVEVSPDGSNYTRFDNTANATFSFGSSTDSIDTNLGFSRYPVDTNPQSATPRFGYNGQSVDLWELFVNPETPRSDDIGETIARAIIPPNTTGIVNETVKEAGLKSDDVLLTRHELASFDLLPDQRLASSETTRFSGDN